MNKNTYRNVKRNTNEERKEKNFDKKKRETFRQNNQKRL